MNFQVTPEVLEDIKEHGAKEAPREACGLIVIFKGRMQYRPCENMSEGLHQFIINPEQLAKVEDQAEVVAIAHTHVFVNPSPSMADLAGIEATQLPWVVVNHPTGTHTVTQPSGYKTPLIGRTFTHGIHDCFATARDYYATKNILIPNYIRPDDWWKKGQNLLVDNFASAGFVRVQEDQMQVDDAVLMMIEASVPNHCGVIVQDCKILHHVFKRLSGIDVYGGYWRHVTTHVLRYKGKP